MLSVTLYSRAGCKLCKEAEEELMVLQKVIPLYLTVIDIDIEPLFHNTYAMVIPVVEVGGFKLKAPFTQQDLKRTLMAAEDQVGTIGNE
jgi:hypothetical protein